MQLHNFSLPNKHISRLVNSRMMKTARLLVAYGNRFQIQKLNALTEHTRQISNSRAVKLVASLSQRGNKIIRPILKLSVTRQLKINASTNSQSTLRGEI